MCRSCAEGYRRCEHNWTPEQKRRAYEKRYDNFKKSKQALNNCQAILTENFGSQEDFDNLKPSDLSSVIAAIEQKDPQLTEELRNAATLNGTRRMPGTHNMIGVHATERQILATRDPITGKLSDEYNYDLVAPIDFDEADMLKVNEKTRRNGIIRQTKAAVIAARQYGTVADVAKAERYGKALLAIHETALSENSYDLENMSFPEMAEAARMLDNTEEQVYNCVFNNASLDTGNRRILCGDTVANKTALDVVNVSNFPHKGIEVADGVVLTKDKDGEPEYYLPEYGMTLQPKGGSVSDDLSYIPHVDAYFDEPAQEYFQNMSWDNPLHHAKNSVQKLSTMKNTEKLIAASVIKDSYNNSRKNTTEIGSSYESMFGKEWSRSYNASGSGYHNMIESEIAHRAYIQSQASIEEEARSHGATVYANVRNWHEHQNNGMEATSIGSTGFSSLSGRPTSSSRRDKIRAGLKEIKDKNLIPERLRKNKNVDSMRSLRINNYLGDEEIDGRGIKEIVADANRGSFSRESPNMNRVRNNDLIGTPEKSAEYYAHQNKPTQSVYAQSLLGTAQKAKILKESIAAQNNKGKNPDISSMSFMSTQVNMSPEELSQFKEGGTLRTNSHMITHSSIERAEHNASASKDPNRRHKVQMRILSDNGLQTTTDMTVIPQGSNFEIISIENGNDNNHTITLVESNAVASIGDQARRSQN